MILLYKNRNDFRSSSLLVGELASSPVSVVTLSGWLDFYAVRQPRGCYNREAEEGSRLTKINAVSVEQINPEDHLIFYNTKHSGWREEHKYCPVDFHKW